MNEPDLSQVEKRFTKVLKKERREAIGYTVLIVLCTPAFVVLVSMMGMFIFFFVLGHSHYDIDAAGVYSGINIFLAIMLSGLRLFL